MIDLVSLFSGAGALDMGFQSSGRFRTRLRVEYQEEFCETLLVNQEKGFLESAELRKVDVRSLGPTDLPARRKRSSAFGIVGGPPCESFSTMGLRAGHEDPRGTLVFTFARLVVDSSADFFVLENVPELAKANGGTPFQELLEFLGSSGYAVSHRVLSAADYGAATVRRRLFVLGVRGPRPLRFPHPTHGAPLTGLPPCRTVRVAFAGLPPPSDAAPGVPQAHVRVAHTPEVVDRFSRLGPGQYDYIRRRSRLLWDEPSPSLVAGNLNGIRSLIHPDEPRELTSRESARVQGFSDAFVFAGSPAAIGKQVANAVPIALAEAIGMALADQL